MIDLHSHVLSSIDDGPATIEGSIELARAAVAAGIGTLVATPHVSSRYPNDSHTIAERVRALNARLREERVELSVVAGAEIALTHIAEIEPAQLAQLGLGGGQWLLVEPPFTPIAPNLDHVLLDLMRDGHRIVLAHPERCAVFRRDRRMLESLADAGVLLSITAGSLVGRFGGEVRSYAFGLARDGMIHNVTSDAHDCTQRPPSISYELQQAGLGPLADWLVQDVPAAILSGEEVPPRPAVELAGGPTRRWWRRR